jgi:hypothetical protein
MPQNRQVAIIVKQLCQNLAVLALKLTNLLNVAVQLHAVQSQTSWTNFGLLNTAFLIH